MAEIKGDAITMIAEEDIPNAVIKIGAMENTEYVGKAVCYGTTVVAGNPTMVLAQSDNVENFAGIIKAASSASTVAMDGYKNDGNRTIPEGEGASVDTSQITSVKISDDGPVAYPDLLTLADDGELKVGDADDCVARALESGAAGSIIRARVFQK